MGSMGSFFAAVEAELSIKKQEKNSIEDITSFLKKKQLYHTEVETYPTEELITELYDKYDYLEVGHTATEEVYNKDFGTLEEMISFLDDYSDDDHSQYYLIAGNPVQIEDLLYIDLNLLKKSKVNLLPKDYIVRITLADISESIYYEDDTIYTKKIRLSTFKNYLNNPKFNLVLNASASGY